LIVRYPALKGVEKDIEQTFCVLKDCYAQGGRVYLCGNGGSTADCEHIVGELMKCFKKMRPVADEFAAALKAQGELGEELAHDLEGGLPAISLCGHSPLTFAYLNDKNPMLTFAQQLSVMGNNGDVLIALSTSGNSKNCVYAAMVAKAKGMPVFFLGGGTGGKLLSLADVSIVAPESETYKVQECHLPIYHCLCAMLEEEFF
jgi:D-sedoheptulose 7-phosphate isomerase